MFALNKQLTMACVLNVDWLKISKQLTVMCWDTHVFLYSNKWHAENTCNWCPNIGWRGAIGTNCLPFHALHAGRGKVSTSRLTTTDR